MGSAYASRHDVQQLGAGFGCTEQSLHMVLESVAKESWNSSIEQHTGET